MKASRLVHIATIATATALLVSGCSPSSSSSVSGGSGSAECKDGSVELSMWSWRTEDAKAYDKILKKFEDKNPCITVKFQAFKNTEYQQILQTGLGGTEGPDVAQVRSYGQLQPFVEGGSLLPLDDVVPEVKDFDETTLNGAKGKADGKIYGVPLATQTLQVFYNKKIFADNKVEVPTTWKEFEKVNETLLKAGVTPLSVGAKDMWTLPILHDIFGSAQYGGSEFQEKILTGQTTFEDPGYVSSIDTVKSLEKYMPKDVVGVGYTDAQVLFTSEQAAMFPGGSFELSFFQKQNPNLELGVFQAPTPDDSVLDHSVTPSYADGNWAISASSKKQDAAKTLIKWLATPEFGQLVADELKQFSPIPGVTYEDPIMNSMWELYKENSSPYLLLVDFRYGQPLGTDVMGQGIQKLFLGDEDAKTVATELQSGISQWFTPTK